MCRCVAVKEAETAMMAENEVIKYAKYYCGKDEPPAFYNEYFELEDKTFLP